MDQQTFRHTEDMGEISGFGGGYEQRCQDMLEAGVKWLNARKMPGLKGYTDVYGFFVPDRDDAKAMEKAALDAVKGDAPSAMRDAVMSRLFWIARNGWDAYCAEVRKHSAA